MRLETIILLTAAAAFAQEPAAPQPPEAPQPPRAVRPAQPRPMRTAAPARAPQLPQPPAAPRPPLQRSLGGPTGRWWTQPEVAQRLGLTDEQRKRMDEIFQQSRLKLIDLNAAVQKEEVILEPLVSAEQPDEGKIVAQIDRVAQARAELEKANARMLLGIRRVLTPEQWNQLKSERNTAVSPSSGAVRFSDLPARAVRPEVLLRVEPQYTEEARAAKYQGTVVLRAEIAPDGTAQNIRVQRSLGMGLDETAIEALRKWRFIPGKLDGKPVTVLATIEVNFRLP